MAAISQIPSTRAPARTLDDLLERDRELSALRRCLQDARAGAGGMVFVEAPPGGGKSRLLEAARAIAHAARLRVLTAAGSELEREFPFALATRLVGRAAPTTPDGREYALIQEFFDAAKDLAGPRGADEGLHGLAIVIDDVHWADGPSLRLLAYLAERLADLPIAIVLAATTGEPSCDPRTLAALRRTGGKRLLPLAPLSADGIAGAVRERFPEADDELCGSYAQASGGNPFLLTELLNAMAGDEQTRTASRDADLVEIVPDGVREWVAARLDSMPWDRRAVAEAAAVLGEGASVASVARQAGLDTEVTLAAADNLAAIGLLAPEIPMAFGQPMLGAAVRASLAPFERAQAHLRAARVLAEQDAGAELVAQHLLEAPADEDPGAVASLREAAEIALRRGEPERATGMLNRALAEHPKTSLRAQLEAELGAARVESLLIADDLERALEICDATLPPAGNDDPVPAHELSCSARARALYEQGRIADAEVAAAAAVNLMRGGGEGYSQSARAVLARCRIERGRFDEAESVLARMERHDHRDALFRASALDARAQLRLAQHRREEALEDAMHAGALLEEQLPDAGPGSVAWRSSAALAHLALGEPHHARRLAEQELRDARSTGVTRIVVRDLRIIGLALGERSGGVEKLAEAAAIGASHPVRLEYVRALIDYGAALRRAGRRADAREPLRLGLDLSHRAGAALLESQARAELIATGARPRRAVVSGVESLTASQRRVAELAAGGFTTQQIAAALVVTPKTVEFHLRHIYSKLDVSSREELTSALAASSAPVA